MVFNILPIFSVLNRVTKVSPLVIFSNYCLLDNMYHIITNVFTNEKIIQALFPSICNIRLTKFSYFFSHMAVPVMFEDISLANIAYVF